MSHLRLCSHILPLTLLASACGHEAGPHDEIGFTGDATRGSSSGAEPPADEPGTAIVVSNGCEVGVDTRFLVALASGRQCDDVAALGAEQVTAIEPGFCTALLPADFAAWPDTVVTAVEPLCDNLSAQGTFDCTDELPDTYMRGIGRQFDRVAWTTFIEADPPDPIHVAILDTAAGRTACETNPASHGCSVESAVFWGAGRSQDEAGGGLVLTHYQALGEAGIGDVARLHGRLQAAIDDHASDQQPWLIVLALGWRGAHDSPGVDLIRATLTRAQAAGAVIVAAAGNESTPQCGQPIETGMLYPAAYAVEATRDAMTAPLVIPVGAVDVDGGPLDTALSGGIPPLVAPGGQLRMASTDECLFDSGSSIAAGYAAGVAALALAATKGSTDVCTLQQALFVRAGTGLADVSLHVCGREYRNMQPLSACATLAALGVPCETERDESPASDLQSRASSILEAAKQHRDIINLMCDGNYWGPYQVEDLEFSEGCPRADGPLRPGPKDWVSPQGPVKDCPSCAAFLPEGDPNALQVILNPDIPALIDDFLSAEHPQMDAWLVLEWSGDAGSVRFVSDEPVIEMGRSKDGKGVWVAVGEITLASRAVVLVHVPDGVDREDVRVWLRYDQTGEPSRWESLGYPLLGAGALTDEDFYSGTCQPLFDPCMFSIDQDLACPGRDPGARAWQQMAVDL